MKNNLRNALRIYRRPDGWRVWDPFNKRDLYGAAGPMTFTFYREAIRLCYHRQFVFAEPPV